MVRAKSWHWEHFYKGDEKANGIHRKALCKRIWPPRACRCKFVETRVTCCVLKSMGMIRRLYTHAFQPKVWDQGRCTTRCGSYSKQGFRHTIQNVECIRMILYCGPCPTSQPPTVHSLHRDDPLFHFPYPTSVPLMPRLWLRVLPHAAWALRKRAKAVSSHWWILRWMTHFYSRRPF